MSLEGLLLSKRNQVEDNTGGLQLGDTSSHQTPETAEWRLTRTARGMGTADGQSFYKGDSSLGRQYAWAWTVGTAHAAEGTPVVCRSQGAAAAESPCGLQWELAGQHGLEARHRVSL